MKSLAAIILALLLSVPTFGQSFGDDLIHVSSYDMDVRHMQKFISREKTQCDVNTCITVDLTIVSDNAKGIEPGKNRIMFVTMIKFDLEKRAALFLTVAQFDFVDNIPQLRSVLGSPDKPAASRWVLIPDGNPLSQEIDLLIKLKSEFSGVQVDSTM